MSKELIVKWKIRDSEVARVLAMLPELAEKTRSEEGNVAYSIYQSEKDPGELVLYEHYIDADAAEAHRKSGHYQQIVANGIIPYLDSREVSGVRTLL